MTIIDIAITITKTTRSDIRLKHHVIVHTYKIPFKRTVDVNDLTNWSTILTSLLSIRPDGAPTIKFISPENIK